MVEQSRFNWDWLNKKMFLYILKNSKNGKYYIGITNNVERRLKEHNKSGKHYTGIVKGDWEIIFKNQFKNEKDARKEEIRHKKCKNREYLEWYINNVGVLAQR